MTTRGTASPWDVSVAGVASKASGATFSTTTTLAGTPTYGRFVNAAGTATAVPVIKWAGGKTRLLPELLARLPVRFGRYYEPFAGGAALFFRLAPERAVLGDANADLIRLYEILGGHPGNVRGVVDRLRALAAEHSPERYLEVRARWNSGSAAWTSLDRAAAFVYLNKTCFNGLWRVNRAGHFNVPIGDITGPHEVEVGGLEAAAAALRRAILRRGDYRDTVTDAVAGDLVYLDPPYDGTFSGYTPGAFGPAEQRDLAELARDLVARGVHVVASNADTPLVRELYAGFRLDSITSTRSIAATPDSRGPASELVIWSPPISRRLAPHLAGE